MQIGGLQKLSLIDYPGQIAAVVFTQGCNFRCPFCHNRDLVLPDCYRDQIPVSDVLQFLDERWGKLQAVVISGGEPTLQKGLLPFMEKVKRLGYAIKLDTNGSRPRVLERIIKKRLVDFIAMDVKGPPDRYDILAGVPIKIEDIRESIRLIVDSGVEHLFRTTVVKPYLSGDDLRRTAEMARAGQRYVLQEFIAVESVLNNTLMDRGHYTHEEFRQLQSELQREEVSV